MMTMGMRMMSMVNKKLVKMARRQVVLAQQAGKRETVRQGRRTFTWIM